MANVEIAKALNNMYCVYIDIWILKMNGAS